MNFLKHYVENHNQFFGYSHRIEEDEIQRRWKISMCNIMDVCIITVLDIS